MSGSTYIDCVYKQTASGSLYLRVYPSDAAFQSATSDGNPWSLLIHGGGFLHGAHTSPYWWHLVPFLAKGIHVVSIAYRFAPHVTYEEIVQDCEDAYEWCKTHLSETLRNGDHRPVATDRCVLMGESAGGTLALTLGTLVRPRPKCVVDCYGLVDFTATFPFPVMTFPIDGTVATEEEILGEVEARDTSHAAYWCPGDIARSDAAAIEARHGTLGTPFQVDQRAKLQFEIFKYLFPRHLSTSTLFNKASHVSLDTYTAELQRHSVTNMVDKEFPPTFILHGTADNAVKWIQSQALAAKLGRLGVRAIETYVEGAEHCMDMAWTVSGFLGGMDSLTPC